MGTKTLAFIMVLCSSLGVHYTIRGREYFKQELQWDEQFKLMNKPSVKTIKTKHEDLYNCVVFNKRPESDHPLLKNHSFPTQMRPNFSSELVKDKTVHQGDEVLLDSMKLQDRGCPVGTVPIRRWTKDEFLNMTRFTKDYALRFKPNSTGTHFILESGRAKISVKLINGDDENPADVYGLISGRYGIHSEYILFYRPARHYIDVKPGANIPLSISEVLLPEKTTSLEIKAYLMDYDFFSFDDEIANGKVVFLVKAAGETDKKNIVGKYGSIEVNVVWGRT